MPSDGNYLVPMARSLIRRFEQFTVTVAGANVRDLKLYEGEILAGITVQNETNHCLTQASYRAGGNYDGAVAVIKLSGQPIGEARSVVYPLGRIRMRAGDIRFTYHGCIIGDVLGSYLVVEQRWPH